MSGATSLAFLFFATACALLGACIADGDDQLGFFAALLAIVFGTLTLVL